MMALDLKRGITMYGLKESNTMNVAQRNIIWIVLKKLPQILFVRHGFVMYVLGTVHKISMEELTTKEHPVFQVVNHYFDP